MKKNKIKQRPKVSFYVPTINSSDKLVQCVKSILQQGIKPNEILIIDGNKDEDKVKFLMKEISYPSLRIIRQSGKGLANARNLAIKNSRFEFVASCDDDVVLDKTWLSICLSQLHDPDIIGVGGMLKEKINYRWDKWRAKHMKQNWGNKKIENPNFLFGSNTVIRKEFLKKTNYDERYISNYEDVDISIRLKHLGKIIYLPEAKGLHQKEDDFNTLLKANYDWTYFSYIEARSFVDVMTRAVFHLSRCLKYLFSDLLHPNFVLFDISLFFYSIRQDLKKICK